MIKKSLLLLVLTLIIAEGVFAQTDFKTMPKNTITVDIGPTIIGVAIGQIGSVLGGGDGLSSSGFGIAAQYERQLFEKLSVGGRFAYLGGGVGIAMEEKDQGVTIKTELGMSLSSFSLEGHVRFYPFSKTFFLDGMLGYANMTTVFSGGVIGKDNYGHKQEEKVSLTASRGFFKYGGKLGWRIDFGKPGGFIFEPSFGYSGGVGFGDSIGKKLTKEVGSDADVGDFDEIFGYIENFIFVGGPRLSLAFGWRF